MSRDLAAIAVEIGKCIPTMKWRYQRLCLGTLDSFVCHGSRASGDDDRFSYFMNYVIQEMHFFTGHLR